MTRETLVVSELFGPTFQGEGPSLGRRCSFLRLGGCNLHCAWCDTPYTWDWSGRNGRRYDPRTELRRIPVAEIWRDLRHIGAQMLVVSGGEPLLQQNQLVPLLERAKHARMRVEIETAGTIGPSDAVVRLADQFNVSPKLAHSQNELDKRHSPEAIDRLQNCGKAVWKFVVKDLDDLNEIGVLVDRYQLTPIYVMPEGTTPEAIVRGGQELADAVLQRGWNLTTRLHILLFGNRRGV